MPKPTIDFCFQGWIRGAEINNAIDTKTGNNINVENMTSKELIEKLNNGELAISFKDALKNNDEENIELHDYEENTYS